MTALIQKYANQRSPVHPFISLYPRIHREDVEPIGGKPETFHPAFRVVDSARKRDEDLIIAEATMKKDLHPDYNKITIHLSDGSTFETRSTLDQDEFSADVDSKNHPFYTGRRQFVDTAGRVEKFNRRYGLNQDDEEEEEADESEE